ncbi:MAG: hypothetical protein ACKUBY_01560 [Candidatus Moraniibacteriota bacterium]|jgi:tRNA A37 threonylcarbamoyladenosine modification protein TsaB
MHIKLELKEKNVSLVLLDGENKIDEENWVDENNLLEKFFPIIDDMLKRNNTNIDNVEKFNLETNIPEGYTTARIAKTIIKTLNFAHNS